MLEANSIYSPMLSDCKLIKFGTDSVSIPLNLGYMGLLLTLEYAMLARPEIS